MGKRMIALFAAAALAVSALCGCTKHSARKELCADFKVDFTAEYRGMKLAGKLMFTRQGDLSLTFSQPKTLDGLDVHYRNNTLSLSRDSAVCTADEGYLPECSFPETVRSVLKAAAQGSAKPVERGGETVYRLSSAQLDCEITADTDGMIGTVSANDGQLQLLLSGAEKI